LFPNAGWLPVGLTGRSFWALSLSRLLSAFAVGIVNVVARTTGAMAITAAHRNAGIIGSPSFSAYGLAVGR
jgi:hypothetical protein